MKILTAILSVMLAVSACATSAQDDTEKTKKTYANSYAVVVDDATYNDTAWKIATDALVQKRNATLVRYQKDVFDALPDLQKIFPKYICFVRTPDDIKAKFVADAWRITRQLDSDPYGDAIHGILTGYTAEDALRVINCAEPKEIETCLAQTSIGPDRFKESLIISDGERDAVIQKTAEGQMKKTIVPGDKSDIFVDYFEKMAPDMIVTSSHGAQNTIEMPSSKGRIVSQNGKVWYKYNGSTIDLRTGQSSVKNISTKNLSEVKTPSKPNLFFAVGNCLVGEVNKRDCMVTAAFHSLNTVQFVGYNFTTWYGQMGHLALRYLEQGGGYTPMNEAIFFANQVLLDDLGQWAPNLQRYNFPNVSSSLSNFGGFNRMVAENANQRIPRQLQGRVVGHMWDRDCVAFYGDPAHEIYLSKEHTFKPNITTELFTDSDVWRFELTAQQDCGEPNEYTAQRCTFFPERIREFTVIKGAEFKPVITDNFIMVRKPGPVKKGEKIVIEFKVEKF